MKASVLVFPGSNCDRDVKVALEGCGAEVKMVWHNDNELPDSDLIVVPGGFSYGDYLRSGAISAHSNIMKEVISFAAKGGYVLGICNGFQILTEANLLQGTLMRNKGIKFICKDVHLSVENSDTVFTKKYAKDQIIKIPVAHHDGNYFADEQTIRQLEDNNQIAFRYVDSEGNVNANTNPNGSINNIAGVYNKNRNVLGMMPHPERMWENALSGTDGRGLFDSIINA